MYPRGYDKMPLLHPYTPRCLGITSFGYETLLKYMLLLFLGSIYLVPLLIGVYALLLEMVTIFFDYFYSALLSHEQMPFKFLEQRLLLSL